MLFIDGTERTQGAAKLSASSPEGLIQRNCDIPAQSWHFQCQRPRRARARTSPFVEHQVVALQSGVIGFDGKLFDQSKFRRLQELMQVSLNGKLKPVVF